MGESPHHQDYYAQLLSRVDSALIESEREIEAPLPSNIPVSGTTRTRARALGASASDSIATVVGTALLETAEVVCQCLSHTVRRGRRWIEGGFRVAGYPGSGGTADLSTPFSSLTSGIAPPPPPLSR